MPTGKPRGRRQQKVAFERALRSVGLWSQFVQVRERLKSVSISAPDAWDMTVAAYIERYPELSKVLNGTAG